MQIRLLAYYLTIGWLCSLPAIVYGQRVVDVGIFDVRMHLITPDTGETQRITPDQLGAYMYDIGPTPRVRFEILVDTKSHLSRTAPRLDLVIERYALMASREVSAYDHLPNKYPDASFSEPAWVYSGPIQLAAERVVRDDTLRFVTAPFAIDFLDPDNPLTFALPVDFKLPGFAYRFLLKPSGLRSREADPTDNTFQLSFMKH